VIDVSSLADFGLGWLEASGPHADIVLSTRVRLARNLQGHAFSPRIRDADFRQLYPENLIAAIGEHNHRHVEIFPCHSPERLQRVHSGTVAL